MELLKKLKKVGFSAAVISIMIVLGKVCGFVREIVLSHYYGTSNVTDAYIMNGNIVGVLFGWFSTLYVCFTPIYLQTKKHGGNKQADEFTRNVITIFTLLAVLCVGLVYCIPEQIVSFIAPGFDPETKDLTLRFLKISVLILLVHPFTYPLKSYLECNDHFIESSVPDVLVSVLQVVIIALSGFGGTWLLPFAMFVPYLAQGICLKIFSRRKGFKYYPQIQGSSELKTLFQLLGPYFVSSLIVEINSMVDRYFASSLQRGSITVLNYASTLNSFVMNVFSIALLVIVYTKMSSAIAEKDTIKYQNILKKGIQIILFLFFPVTVGVIILAPEIVTCVYGHGEFSPDRVYETANVFRMYALSLAALAVRELLMRAMYSVKNMKIPISISLLSTFINMILNVILVKHLGAMGLAIATSASVIVVLPVYFILVKKYQQIPILEGSGFAVLLPGVLSIAMGLAVYGMRVILSGVRDSYVGNWLSLLVCTMVGIMVYFVLSGMVYLANKRREKVS